MYHRVTPWSLVSLSCFSNVFSIVILRFKNPKSYGVCLNNSVRNEGFTTVAFSEPKALFLHGLCICQFQLHPFPPPGLLWGICPSCQPRRGMGTAGIDWCITVMVKENICENIIQLLTPSPWNPGKILGTHTSNIWEFSSSKGIHDSIGVWIPLHGFQNPVTGSFVGGTWNWF